MKIELKLNEKKQTVNLSNNILAIYGENNSGKTLLIDNLYDYFKRHYHDLYFESNFKNFSDVIKIEQNYDFKKEFSLSKNSTLRNNLVKSISELFETKQLENVEQIIKNEALEKIIEVINQKTFFKNDLNYSFKLENKLIYPPDIIDNLIKISIEDNDGRQVNELKISQSDLKKLYFNFIISSKSTNLQGKIFLFDCPDVDFDDKNLNWLATMINKLAIDNFIVVTSRNIKFLIKLKINFDDLYYQVNKQLTQLNYSKELGRKHLIISEYLQVPSETNLLDWLDRTYNLISGDEINKNLDELKQFLPVIFDNLIEPFKVEIGRNNIYQFKILLFIITFLLQNNFKFDKQQLPKLNGKQQEVIDFLIK